MPPGPFLIFRRHKGAPPPLPSLAILCRHCNAVRMLCESGDIDRATALAAECQTIRPSFSIGWFMSKRPFRNAADAGHLAESLSMCGFA